MYFQYSAESKKRLPSSALLHVVSVLSRAHIPKTARDYLKLKFSDDSWHSSIRRSYYDNLGLSSLLKLWGSSSSFLYNGTSSRIWQLWIVSNWLSLFQGLIRSMLHPRSEVFWPPVYRKYQVNPDFMTARHGRKTGWSLQAVEIYRPLVGPEFYLSSEPIYILTKYTHESLYSILYWRQQHRFGHLPSKFQYAQISPWHQTLLFIFPSF